MQTPDGEARSRRPRDAQRSRIYRAEHPMPSSPLPGLDACRAYAERVVGTLWWQARFPEHSWDRLPRFRPGNGARQAFFAEHHDGEQTITLPRRYRTKGVVLHELAHWALFAQPDLPDHGATFARLLLDATCEFLGPERAMILTTAYTEERVRVGRQPRVGPGGRLHYGWDERLRLGRGRVLRVRSCSPRGSRTITTGTFLGHAKGGCVVRIEDADGFESWVDEKAIYAVDPLDAGAGSGLAADR
jgi:putative metallohydrolase (TIGR04338 family)